MSEQAEENRNKRRDKKRKKGRYGMIINYAGRKLAEILKQKQEKDVRT